MSFELNCDLIMLQTDSFSLVNRISSLRPRAYTCVFSDDPKLKHATALNFGVYCFPKKFESRLTEFLADHGARFCLKKATALHISTDTKGNIKKLTYDIASAWYEKKNLFYKYYINQAKLILLPYCPNLGLSGTSLCCSLLVSSSSISV